MKFHYLEFFYYVARHGREGVRNILTIMRALLLGLFVLLSLANPVAQASAATLQNEIPPRERKVTLEAKDLSFKDALAQVCRAADVELELDAEAVKEAGVSPDSPITISFKDVRLDAVMPELLSLLTRGEFFDIFWKLEDTKILVTTLRADEARTMRDLPDWMKPFYTKGLIAKLDKDRQVVSIFTGDIPYDEFFGRLKSLPRLRELDIEPTKNIDAAQIAQLAELPALQKINLYGVNRNGSALGNEALRAVSQIKTLRDLSISECGVTDEGVPVLRGMTQLTNLCLAGNRLSDAALKHIAGLTNLHGLDISGSLWANSSMAISDEGLKELSGLTRIRQLSTGNLNISGNTISFPHLEVLTLSGSMVTDSALVNIVKNSPDLRRLQLSFTGVSDKGLNQLAALKELRQLNLYSGRITDEGIGYLTALPKLEHVDLRATGISDKSLAHLAKIKSLTRLDLHGSGISGVNYGHLFTIKGLQQLKNLPELRVLWISNFESGTGYDGLRELTQLRLLHFYYTNITDDEEAALQKAMPRTRVSADRGGIMRIRRVLPPQT